MQLFNLANNYTSTPTGSFNDAATSFTVADSLTAYGLTAPFIVLLYEEDGSGVQTNHEIIHVGAAGNTGNVDWSSITRAAEPVGGVQTAFARTTASKIAQIMTASGFLDLLNRQYEHARSVFYIRDDFAGGTGSSGDWGEKGWAYTNGTATGSAPAQGRVGVGLRQTGTTINTIAYSYLGAASTFHTADTFDMTYMLRLDQTADTDMRIGCTNNLNGNPPVNGIYFEKLTADTNWWRVCRSGGSQTREDTTVAVNTSAFQRFRIRRVDASNIGFSIDGGTEALISTQVPSTAMQPWLQLINTAAVNKTFSVDLFEMLISGLSR